MLLSTRRRVLGAGAALALLFVIAAMQQPGSPGAVGGGAAQHRADEAQVAAMTTLAAELRDLKSAHARSTKKLEVRTTLPFGASFGFAAMRQCLPQAPAMPTPAASAAAVVVLGDAPLARDCCTIW